MIVIIIPDNPEPEDFEYNYLGHFMWHKYTTFNQPLIEILDE